MSACGEKERHRDCRSIILRHDAKILWRVGKQRHVNPVFSTVLFFFFTTARCASFQPAFSPVSNMLANLVKA